MKTGWCMTAQHPGCPGALKQTTGQECGCECHSLVQNRDWRLPEHRSEAFQRFYSLHLKYRAHPGLVYSWLPAMSSAMDDEQKAWVVWLNGNTQNPVTTSLLLRAAPSHYEWKNAVDYWNEYFKLLEWDTDRRHQKSKFGEATEQWISRFATEAETVWQSGMAWSDAWSYARSQPYMGRLSAWSMLEYARILFGPVVPDAADLLLRDWDGSRSHRNGLAFIAGFESVYWGPEVAKMLDIVDSLEELGESLLQEARERNPDSPDVSRLTLESALCTYKSWHKPNRRYTGVYADMAYLRLKRAEERFSTTFPVLWSARQKDLPEWMRLEDRPNDPGLVPEKQNYYRETGIPIGFSYEYSDVICEFDQKAAAK